MDPSHNRTSESSPSVPSRDDLLTRPEAAAYIKSTTATLARWAAWGVERLPFYRLGKRVYYSTADLDAFIEGRRVEPHSPGDGDSEGMGNG